MSAGRPSIYGLYDADGSLRYIGKANNPKRRLASHMRDARRRRTPLYDWINKHGRPEMRVIDAECADWREAERRLIAEARARGDKLLNLADGGDQPSCSPDVRKRNGRALAGRLKADPEFRRIREMKRHMACALRDGFVSNQARAKLRAAAETRPNLFGLWKHIPDRPEDENGEPIGGYGKLKGGRIGALYTANA